MIIPLVSRFMKAGDGYNVGICIIFLLCDRNFLPIEFVFSRDQFEILS